MFSQDARLGEGERLQRKRERQVLAVKCSLFAVGMLSGAWIGYHFAADEYRLDQPWPPTVAVGLAVLYVAAIAIGSVLLNKRIDEVEKMQTYKAVAVASTAYLVGYPVWFLLWKASLVPEPSHSISFIAFWALLISSNLFYRSR